MAINEKLPQNAITKKTDYFFMCENVRGLRGFKTAEGVEHVKTCETPVACKRRF